MRTSDDSGGATVGGLVEDQPDGSLPNKEGDRKTHFVCGFAFTDATTQASRPHVILINKKRPSWQAGFYNGVGGKVQDLETNYQAMAREFFEETGCGIRYEEWDWFLQLHYPSSVVDFFRTFQPDLILGKAHSRTDEMVVQFDMAHVSSPHCKLIPNLKWIIPYAAWEEPVVRAVPISLEMKRDAWETS